MEDILKDPDPYSMVFQLVVLLIATIGNGYMTYWITYMGKKGEYKMLKEEIEEVTKKVEAIKADFLVQTERIKSDLNFLNQRKLTIATEEKDAIMNFSEKHSIWYNLMVNAPYPITLTDSRVEELFNKIENARLDFYNAEARLYIFLNSIEVSKLVNKLAVSTLETEGKFKQTLWATKMAANNADHYKANTGSSFDINVYKDRLNDIGKPKKEFHKYCIDVLNEHRIIQDELRDYFRNRLFEVLSDT